MLTLHVHDLTPWASRALIFSMALMSAACATENAALQRAQLAYEQARQDPETRREAPLALHEAEQALRQAEQARDEEEVNHLAYLAERGVEIARAEAGRKTAEARAERQLKERDHIVIDARTREAEEARAEAAEAQAAVKQLAIELADLQAKETERGLVLTLGDVLFDYNRASLKPGAQQNLYRLVTYLKEHPQQLIVIEGHTDSHGSDSYNLDLSQRRAQAVQGFLIGNGIGPERITARGLGEGYPLASNDSEAGRQQNRRVEIVLPTPSKPGIATSP